MTDKLVDTDTSHARRFGLPRIRVVFLILAVATAVFFLVLAAIA
ncbi:hypothetical protein EDF51_11330 [Curtobacterium sp. PhB25]|nr:hypothetical protein [Curtobacterium sp. PhB25]TDW64666.1 hypothetical protein EDF51_11330 [Curtobacterium sp. PhB25]